MNRSRSNRMHRSNRRTLLAFLTCLLCLVVAPPGQASGWIERISGHAGDVEINRGGERLAAAEMTRLEAGDRISVHGASTNVRVLLGDGSLRELGQGKPSFTVPGGDVNSSLFSNLMHEAASMLSASSSRTETISAITRGKGDRTAFLPQPAEQNLVYVAEGELTVAWTGGTAPFIVALSNADTGSEVAGSKDINGQPFTLTIKDLPAGDYRLMVRAMAPGALSEALVTLVGPEDLPAEIQEIYELALDERVRARLLIARAMNFPEWRMFAYSLAARHGLGQEMALLAASR